MRRAFSLVEMVVASGISALVFTVGALSYQTITAQQRRHVTYATIEIGNSASENYYGKLNTPSIDAYNAPNYGRGNSADLLREKFYEDLNSATAVYCLGRDGLNPARPSLIPLTYGTDAKSLDTPEAFRIHLESVVPALASTHTAYAGASTAKNLSVYMIQQSAWEESLVVRAIYEIDIQSTTNPVGTYCTVRRYAFSILTDFYDVFYPVELGATAFNPLAVSFERDIRKGIGTDDGFDKFRVAKQEPFYFMWWPDPSIASLDGDAFDSEPTYTETNIHGASSSVGDPRSAYFQMGGRTSYMFTFPMFPTL